MKSKIPAFKMIWLLAASAATTILFCCFLDTVPPRNLTEARMWGLKRGILRFAREHDRLPAELSVLPQMAEFSNSTKDGWGREIKYEIGANFIVTLTSLGSDGSPGGDGEGRDIVKCFHAKTPEGDWAGELSPWCLEAEKEEGVTAGPL